MCTSTATLLYGLWVTTASLTFAATAHHRTRSPFHAIDLILLRRRSGSLKTKRGKGGAVKSIPPEVWEQIKQSMILVEARDAELQAIAPMRCRQCLKQEVLLSLLANVRLHPEATGITFTVKYKWDRWESPDCEGCCDMVFVEGFDLLATETIKHIKDLLEPFGLCMPVERVWHTDPGSEPYAFDSLSPISLPLRGSNALDFPQVQAEDDHDYEYASSHAVANISPAIFDLPPDVHLRFASLVKTYGLEVVDRTTSEILPAQAPPLKAKVQDATSKGSKIGGAGSPKGKEKEKKDKRELKFGRVEPRWMLWSVGDQCD